MLYHKVSSILLQLADWSLKRGFVYKQPVETSFPQGGMKHMNKTFIVTTIEVSWYIVRFIREIYFPKKFILQKWL